LPFAVALAHEATRAGGSGATPFAAAPEALWRACSLNNEAGAHGTSLAATTRAVERSGQTSADVWPYDASLGHLTEEVPPAAQTSSWFRAGSVEIPLRHDRAEALVEDALAVALPVVLVLEVTSEFKSPDGDGEVDIPPLTANPGGYHAVLVVGAATNTDDSRRRLLIQNSWGPLWGVGGYGWLPIGYLESFAVQAAVLDPTWLSTEDHPNLPQETRALWN